MSRTQRNWLGDLPKLDGMIWFGPDEMSLAAGGATGAITRVASGIWSLRISTTSAGQISIPIDGSVIRRGMQDDLQEQFGSLRAGGAQGLPIGWPNTLSSSSATAGSAVSVSVLSTVNFTAGQYVLVDTVASGVQEYTQIISITNSTTMVMNLVNSHTTPFPIAANVFTTPAGVSGPPPFAGVTEFTPVTAPRPKGLLVKQITPAYIINTTNITTNTIGVTSIQYNNNVVNPAATTILTNAANGLATTASANPYVTPIAIPVANQSFLTTPNTAVVIEWDVTAASTGSVDLLGVFVDFSFNYS